MSLSYMFLGFSSPPGPKTFASMYPLKGRDSRVSARASTNGRSPARTRPHTAAVGGVLDGSYSTPPRQLSMHGFQRQYAPQQKEDKSFFEAASVLPRTSSTVSRGTSYQLLDTEGKRAAVAAYPSASEVLLRHASSQNVPTFHPRPHSPRAADVHQSSTASAVTPAAVLAPPPAGTHATTAAPSGVAMVPGAGPYVPVPLRGSVGSVPSPVYKQGANIAARTQQPQSVRPQPTQQPPLAGLAQRKTVAQYPPFPTYPGVYQQQQQPHQQRHTLQASQSMRAQQLQRYYSGPHLGRKTQLQQHHSFSASSGKKVDDQESTPFLKSALRSRASSLHESTPPPSHIRSAGSVRFAADEEEVFYSPRNGGTSQEVPEGFTSPRLSPTLEERAQGAAPLTEAAPSREPLETATAAKAAKARGAANGAQVQAKGEAAPAAAETATKATKPAAPTPVLGATATTAPLRTEGQEASAVQTAAAKALHAETTIQKAAPAELGKDEVQKRAPQSIPRKVESEKTTSVPQPGAAAAGGGQQRKEGVNGDSSGRVQAAKNPEEVVLMYRPVETVKSELPRTAVVNSRAEGSGREAKEVGTGSPSSKEVIHPRTQATRGSPDAAEVKSSRGGGAATGAVGPAGYVTGTAAGTKQNPVSQQQQQQMRQPEQAKGFPQQGEAGQGRDRDIEKQQTVQQPQQPQGKEQQAAVGERREKSLSTSEEARLPCLWLAYSDHPHICINFFASFQPELLVRRSSAPAVHIYVEGEFPIKNYFVMESAVRAEKEKSAALAAGATATLPVTTPGEAGFSIAKKGTAKKESDVTLREQRLLPTAQEATTEWVADQRADAEAAQKASDAREETGGKVMQAEEKDASKEAAGGAAERQKEVHGLVAAGDVVAQKDVERVAQEPGAQGLSLKDWIIMNLFFPGSISNLRQSANLLHPETLPLTTAEKAGRAGSSRRGSTLSTDDEISVDEQEWRWEMARPTILLHRPVSRKIEHPPPHLSPIAASRGSLVTTDGERVLIVVDTTSEWWPSVQVRWVDGEKEELQRVQLQTERHAQQPQEQSEQGGAVHYQETEGAAVSADGESHLQEDQVLMQKGHPTSLPGVCLWSNHKFTLLDMRI